MGRKLERVGLTTEPAEVAVEPPKRKKEILTAPDEPEGQTVQFDVDPAPPKKKKKKKEKLTVPSVEAESAGQTVKGDVDPVPPKKKKKKKVVTVGNDGEVVKKKKQKKLWNWV